MPFRGRGQVFFMAGGLAGRPHGQAGTGGDGKAPVICRQSLPGYPRGRMSPAGLAGPAPVIRTRDAVPGQVRTGSPGC